tara:strand:- start:121 stop:1395 length:1275 start_codon:yes stop_codon:yes gene_type:complete
MYRVLTTLLYPFLFLFVYFRKILNKEDPKRFKEKILISHYNVNPKNKSNLIWFHAASIGEFKSIIPIINQLNKNQKKFHFLITTTTLSSGNLATIELIKIPNAEHRYIPFDVPFLIDEFLNLWKPTRIFLVDSEIWPNLILKAKKYKIPIALINARLTSKSFQKWMIFPKIAKKIFGIFDLCICSNVETKNYFEKLNLKKVYFKGNIKLINQIDASKITNLNHQTLLKRKFWFAASTHKEEDSFCLKTHIKLKKKFKNVLTIIAPRHINRSFEIRSLAENLKLKAQILNKGDTISENIELIIINYFGALQSYFKYAKSVFIGKSMIKKLVYNGGQNPIEAAMFNCKVYHGPYVYNFEEIYKILEINNISKKINNYRELSDHLLLDLEFSQKKIEQISNPLKNLGQKTLIDTMSLVDNFINNDAY